LLRPPRAAARGMLHPPPATQTSCSQHREGLVTLYRKGFRKSSIFVERATSSSAEKACEANWEWPDSSRSLASCALAAAAPRQNAWEPAQTLVHECMVPRHSKPDWVLTRTVPRHGFPDESNGAIDQDLFQWNGGRFARARVPEGTNERSRRGRRIGTLQCRHGTARAPRPGGRKLAARIHTILRSR